MKKSLLNLGKVLTKKEQKNVHGGYGGGASGGGNGDGSGGGSGTGNDEAGTLGRGSLCLRNGPYAHQRCKPGLRCDTGGGHATGICR